MRLLATLLIVAILTSMSPVNAQEESQFIELASDASNDVEFAGTPAPILLPERWATFDLISLRAQETERTLFFEVEVRDLDSSNEITYLESSRVRVFFTHEDTSYRLSSWRWTEAGNSGTGGALYRLNPGDGAWDWVSSLNVTEDQVANTYNFEVSREDIHDANGAAPFPGRSITEVWVVGEHMELSPSTLGSLTPEPSGLVDRLPDTGFGDELLIELGNAQLGSLRLSSQAPYRVSNGEATTMVYDVLVQNKGAVEEIYEFEATEIPNGWSIHFPEEKVTIAQGESRVVQVHATVPFVHQHAVRYSFLIHGTSQASGAHAMIDLGILYTDIPQPSGHHDRVWFHTLAKSNSLLNAAMEPTPGADSYLVFNSEESYEPDSGASVQSSWSVNGDEDSRYWVAYLSPALLMGLDFDLDEEGFLSLPIQATAPMTDMELYVNLWHWNTADRVQYETTKIFEATADAGSWGYQESRVIDVPFSVLKGADRLELDQFQGLTMNIYLRSNGPGNTGSDPHLEPGGFMDLPLIEFHDELAATSTGLPADIGEFPEDLSEANETPIASLGLLLMAVALMVRRRS
jgi:hypothetical protein